MAHKDDRTISIADKGKTSSGYRTVRYRDIKGISHNARVLGGGSSSGLKLLVNSGPSRRIIDNVAAGTGMKQTNRYFSPVSNV
jgi:hypothetical protein